MYQFFNLKTSPCIPCYNQLAATRLPTSDSCGLRIGRFKNGFSRDTTRGSTALMSSYLAPRADSYPQCVSICRMVSHCLSTKVNVNVRTAFGCLHQTCDKLAK